MQRDLRESPLYREAETFYQAVRQPGTGRISDASEISTNGTHACFAGALVDALNGTPPTRICLTELASGDTRLLTFGPNIDRLPKFSPDGRQIAFLSDRRQAGDFQLYLLDPVIGIAQITPEVDGWVEYFHWSPDGKRILLGVAGRGADVAGAQGAVKSKQRNDAAPSWQPMIQTGDESYRWRRAWLYDVATDRVRAIHLEDLNIWEMAWCGNDALAAIASPGPREGLWYTARLHLIDVSTGKSRKAYDPKHDNQLGSPAGSPSGAHVAVIEAICSDRGLVAGDLRLIETGSGEVREIDTRGVDITYTEWRSDRHLLLAGHRNFETVVGLYDLSLDVYADVWASEDISSGGRYVTVAGFNDPGDCVLLGEDFIRGPEIATIRHGTYELVKSFDTGYIQNLGVIDAIESVRWKAPDGLEIQGWLLRPNGNGPYPLVMHIHGGPVWMFHPSWLGRLSAHFVMLLERGYAIFYPNPRGSTGRGQNFSRQVLGDMCGADTYDYLAGLDYLVERGIADPRRLGVTGGSYGGYMTSWLVTQDSRFAAAVAVAPVTNRISYHLLSNIPEFADLFLADKYTNPNGRYFQRSPVMHAHKAKTPTLNICGSLDSCTPPQEAIQFHNALVENGVVSALATYPEEGHGVRRFPAAIDYAARIVEWFEKYIPA